MLALCAGLRLWWGARARRMLAQEIAAQHARGERVWPSDFQTAGVAQSDNAVTYLTQSIGQINTTLDTPAQSNYTYNDWLPYPKFWVRMAEKAIAADGKALELSHEATRHPQIDWNIKMARPAVLTAMRPLNGLRNLANVLGDGAILAHIQGNDALAIQRIEDLLFVSRATDAQPTLVGHLVAIGIGAVATHRLEVIAPELAVDDAPPHDVPAAAPSPTTRPASRRRVQALIAQLLDDDERRARARHAYDAERAMSLDQIQWLTENSRVARPVFDYDALEWLKTAGQFSAAATQPTWPAARAVLPATPAAPTTQRGVTGVARAMSGMLAPSLNRAIETDFRCVGDQRMAAVSLAVRLYRLDHHGAYPPSLRALVPQYLPAVPTDAMAPDGVPFGYVKLQTPQGLRPLVYSVGENGVDDTATRGTSLIPPLPMHGWQASVADQWRDVSPFVPPAAAVPATQPGDMPLSDSAPDDDSTTAPATSEPSTSQSGDQ